MNRDRKSVVIPYFVAIGSFYVKNIFSRRQAVVMGGPVIHCVRPGLFQTFHIIGIFVETGSQITESHKFGIE